MGSKHTSIIIPMCSFETPLSRISALDLDVLLSLIPAQHFELEQIGR